VRCSHDLVFIQIQAGDVRPSELGHLASWTAHAATDIEDFHTGTNSNKMGKVVFVSGDSTVERLSVSESAEVEALAPSVLVKVGSEVVVSIH
jgi:hypothetical protein